MHATFQLEAYVTMNGVIVAVVINDFILSLLFDS